MPSSIVLARPAPSQSRRVIFATALSLSVFLPAVVSFAQDAGNAEQPSSRQEIAQAMQELERKYGKDAVALEGQLLGQAVRSGSVLPALIAVPGVRERDGKHFLAFELDTGIVFNDRDATADQRATQVWADIVDPSLRRFASLTLPADGLVLLINYRHRPYTDLTDLRPQLRDDPGMPESVTFYVLTADAVALAAGGLSSQQLVDRTVVLVEGDVRRLVVPEPTPVPTADPGL